MPGLGYVGSALAVTSGSFYALFNGGASSSDNNYSIGAATRLGGVWSEPTGAAVLTKGAGWESGHVKDPCLVWDGSQYVCYYSGYNGSAYQIGRATASAHTGPWSKYGGNPVIALGAGGSFDDSGCYFPTVLHEPADTGKEWKLWYAANDGSNQTIGYAYSSDGLSFTKVGKVLDVGGVGTWDHLGVIPGAIYKSGATYYLFYGGLKQASTLPKWQGGYATFTDPAGAYTKGGGNPTLVAGIAITGNSQALTSNTAIGSAVVHVSDTSHWTAGEAMLIAADNVTVEMHEIASIDSGTQVTLSGVAASLFTTAHNAVLRPYHEVSVFPRSVLASGATFEMGLAGFQGVDDLSVIGNTLWEGSIGATSSTLTGSWTIDYASGLWLPEWPEYTGWRKYSAENPSYIAAP